MDVVVTEELIELSSSGCGNVVVGLNEPLGLRPIDGCVLGVGKVVSGSVVAIYALVDVLDTVYFSSTNYMFTLLDLLISAYSQLSQILDD